MTTHIANIGYTSGQTLTAQLFAGDSDTVAFTAASVTEATNRKNRYLASFSNVTEGRYLLIYFVAGTAAGSVFVRFAGTDGEVVYPVVDTNVVQVLNDAAVINTDVGTETKQNSILAQIQGGNVVQVPSPNVEGSLVLVQGDTYDGIANPKPSWTVSTDYTDGWTVKLTIRDEADAIVATHTGSVDSATLITVAMTGPTGLPMEGCPGRWQGKFDVQLSKGDSRKTIALDKCYVIEDQTRD